MAIGDFSTVGDIRQALEFNPDCISSERPDLLVGIIKNKRNKLKKILVIGSGPIKIGEAGEFDYSTSQCLKVLKEEHITTVLVNPNIATIQSDKKMADKIYFLPITPYFVEKIIEKERPDGILLSFGGQTALNCGVALHDSGILEKYCVSVLGTPVETINATEDRELFVRKLNEISLKTPKSFAVKSVQNAIIAASKIGYPLIIRSAYALGGLGSAICRNDDELEEASRKAFASAPQILVEEYLEHWKEIEYEVVRDRFDNCITVCNMENFDPMGIHTGESIVVAPSQTLSNSEYHKLREISIRLIRHLGIVGECNVQFALDRNSEDYRIIEVNARLSRSSALASKATGYPLAFVAAKLALGYGLAEINNSITKSTIACFEPALDYVVVKIPRWDLKKFRNVSRSIGSSMKSVGEVMAIGRRFEEALQKALRMLDIGAYGLVCNEPVCADHDIEHELANPTDERIFTVVEAIRKGYSPEKISSLSGIDCWFLEKIKNVVDLESELRHYKDIACIGKELLMRAKQFGFSDKQLSLMFNVDYTEVMKIRESMGIKPVVRQIDTLAAEYPAKTNYLYLTYNGGEDDIDFTGKRKKIIVLGSGVYRIGSSVEFDWCCVNAVFTLRDLGYETIMVNYNPETVSTDYDVCDKLYFDEISFEAVVEVCRKENPFGVIISMGGQIPNNIAVKLHKAGVNVLGTSPQSIDMAEDRHKFSKLLDELGIDQPKWKELTDFSEARLFANRVGYPVLVRPSYVLSGAAMNVAFNDDDLETYLTRASRVNLDYPVVISKFMVNSKEIEIDAVARQGIIVSEAISEHVENAGVHSGDATMIFPAVRLYPETVEKVRRISSTVASSLNISGPFNIQFLAKDNEVMVIECNLRASRSFPFVSKVKMNNLIETATRAIVGADVDHEKPKEIRYVGIKSPQFSFSRLLGADPVLSVEMASTGEVACLGSDVYDAFLKAILAAGFKMPRKNILLSIGGDENKQKFIPYARKLVEKGYSIFATDNTSKMLDESDIANVLLHKIHEGKSPNISEYLTNEKLDTVINIPSGSGNNTKRKARDGYIIRRAAADFGIPLITNIQLAMLLVDALCSLKIDALDIRAWDEYN
ncbi:carbamoyl-phosphate synthase (glutamine-hydrolyzing) large subunit [Candidatus Woesearchaeota archaeon]|nr:carbamoyl-phosphate synthase (glutamine-hydrolyzing) large subunit [Candidatus Woesearchaeota archaeon]